MSAPSPPNHGRATRRSVLKAAAAAPLLTALPSAAKERGRPNVLIVITDDQGCELGAYGRRTIRTPRLDQLAREGLRFDNAYTPVSVCVPSRSVLYTGLYPTQSGATGFNRVNKGLRLWGDYLGSAGYHVGSIGKLAVKPGNRFNFDTRAPVEGEADVAWFVEQFESYLAQRPKDKPFCLSIGLTDPHRPFPSDGGRTGWRGAQEEPHDWRAIELPPVLLDTPERGFRISCG